MIYSAVFIGGILVLQAGPVYTILFTHFKDGHLSGITLFWIGFSFTTSIIICIMMVIFPLRFGEKRLLQKLFY
ncbi:hypothetical protein [Desulfocicer vacuolatum]|uniref:hypothetical protein n=1 Tax=Desulfocicer vacuolatum TaxID=2298 RepID=UPI00111C5C9D